jgi:hypothetical protein
MIRSMSVFAVVLACWSKLALAQPVSDLDAGTYAVLGKNGAPSAAAYRFSTAGGKWVAEGKIGGEPWRNISCDAGCEYRVSSASEAESYLPATARQNFTIACIQNIAQAFCRYRSNSNPSYVGYVVMGLVTSPPTPIPVRRMQ